MGTGDVNATLSLSPLHQEREGRTLSSLALKSAESESVRMRLKRIHLTSFTIASSPSLLARARVVHVTVHAGCIVCAPMLDAEVGNYTTITTTKYSRNVSIGDKEVNYAVQRFQL